MSFKRLMVKRNTELNEQAIKAMQNKGEAGVSPEGDNPVKPSKFLQKPLTGTSGDSTNKLSPKSAAKMADELAKNQGKIPENLDEKSKKELAEVMKVANELERADEEAQMKKAMEESEKQLKRQKT